MVTEVLKMEELRLKLDDRCLPALLSKGMNRMVLAIKPFLLRPASFTSQPEGLKPKLVEAQKQYKWYQRALDNPSEPICFCIASEPNDKLAKMAAAFLMQNHLKKSGPRANPVWHDLLGGFQNRWADSHETPPTFIVLANVLPTSTNVKLEKLRDILEVRADIPRIVVTSGADPFSFFHQQLKYPLNGCLYLKSSLVRGDLEV